MKFSKKDFQKKYKTKDIDELYDSSKGEIKGDKPVTHNQITTDTPVVPGDPSSDREEGIPQDSEKQAAQTKNTAADVAVSRFNMGTAYGYVREDDGDLSEAAREKMKKIVKELLNARNDSNDIVRNTSYSDVNRNDIPDMEELEDVALRNKTSEFIELLSQKSPEDIAIVFNEIMLKLNTKEIAPDYKNIIKRNL